MKTLFLLRHAKSSWDHGTRDFDRRLTAKGERAARAMGRHMRDSGIAWDHAIASPAARVVETLAAVGEAYGSAIEPEWDRRVYLAPVPILLDLIHGAPDAADALLIAGHNPGMEELVLTLAREAADDGLRDKVEAKYPTAALAVLTCGGGWGDVRFGTCALTSFTRPRDVDPDLGPDTD